jgi:hypothetical protein
MNNNKLSILASDCEVQTAFVLACRNRQKTGQNISCLVIYREWGFSEKVMNMFYYAF